jgi:formate/nitrite transporter FocA (FNT family)
MLTCFISRGGRGLSPSRRKVLERAKRMLWQQTGQKTLRTPEGGLIGGWMIALVDWTVTASQWTIGQLAMIYLLTFVVGIGRFAHCVAGSHEVGSVVIIAGTLPLSACFHCIFPVIWGNVCGGVFIVSLLNHGQVKEL